MISFEKVKKYCKEDVSLIENYENALADKDNIWDCHHRREITTSKKELIEIGEYYNRPAIELIFLTHSEHTILHNKCEHHSDETKKKISVANKGKTTWMKGKHHSEESKRKISAVMKGKTPWIKGKHHSEETRRKIAEGNKGKHNSPEAKQKMSESRKGRHWWNNGIKSVWTEECPEGFVRGMLKRKKYEEK